MNNRFFKKEKGITLIALVITIIVLLILAVVSISLILGQDGILNKAVDAREALKEAEDYEAIILAAHSAAVKGLGKVDLSDDGALEKALGSDFNYLGDGLVEKDGKYYTVLEDGTVVKGKVEEDTGDEIKHEIKVGDTVTYIPPATVTGEEFNWDAELSGGSNASKTDVALSNQNADYAVTSWKVLNVNSDGTLDLISAEPTTGKLYLLGAQGYNNAVKLLDDACDKLYGNASKGIKGRSIKIEDIENKMTEEGLASAHSYTGSVKYGEQYSTQYTTENNYYPAIYANEELSVIDEVKIDKDKGLGMSEQATYYTDTANASLKAGTSIQPYQTYWKKNAADMKKYLGVTGDLTTSTNYELIMPKKDSTTYWVASRCANAYTNWCSFGVRDVYSGSVAAYGIYFSDGDPGDGNSLALRPVVSLSSDLLKGEVAEDGTVTWSVE